VETREERLRTTCPDRLIFRSIIIACLGSKASRPGTPERIIFYRSTRGRLTSKVSLVSCYHLREVSPEVALLACRITVARIVRLVMQLKVE